jgi:glutathione S-transferase
MLTLFHSPQSRSTRMLWLLEELGLPHDVRYVTIARQDGSGGPDPINPHPDKKVPALLDDGALVTESTAILLHLADKAPAAGLAPPIGDPRRGPYLGWVCWYAAVMEPVNMLGFMGVPETPQITRGMGSKTRVDQRISDALAGQDYLLGDRFSAADLLYADAGSWFRGLLPPGARVDGWIDRCTARPARARALAKDAAPQA